MGEGAGGRRLRLRPTGVSAPEGERLARRGVAPRQAQGGHGELVEPSPAPLSPVPITTQPPGEGKFILERIIKKSPSPLLFKRGGGIIFSNEDLNKIVNGLKRLVQFF